jgi:hypothetical protein
MRPQSGKKSAITAVAPDCGLRIWIGDELNGTAASGRLEADKGGHWPVEGTAALWLHRTVLRLYPDSGYAKRYGERPDALTIEQR